MPERTWQPDYPLDLAGLLAPLRRGKGDPTLRFDPPAGTCWRAATTEGGPATMALRRSSDGTVHATAWGPGAQIMLDGLPALLGAHDDDSGFVAHHPLVAEARRRMPGLRLGTSGRVWDVLLPRCWSRRSPGWRRGARSASCAGASARPHRGRRGRWACACRPPRTRCGQSRTGVAPRGRGLRPPPGAAGRGGRCAPVGARGHAGRFGRPRASAPGAGDRCVDGCRGGAAGLGGPGRGQRRATSTSRRWSAGRWSAGRWTMPACSPCWPHTRHSASERSATSRRPGSPALASAPATPPRTTAQSDPHAPHPGESAYSAR